MTQNLTANRVQTPATWLRRWVSEIGRHWLAGVNLFLGILFFLPWLAPVLMKIGATGLGLLIYTIYSPLCHQFANRSFFLFGPQSMYTYTELSPYAPGANTPLGLKAFVGTAELGYKVAWSDRMVSMYGGVFLGGLIFGLVRRLRARKWWALVLMAFPMVLAGCQQALSDSVEAAEVAQSTSVAVQPAAGPTPASIAPTEAALTLGDTDAPVTIVEFSDYQCPFCARYFQETWPQLKAEFVDTGRVRYVFKDFPLANIHPQSPKAHEAARCAGEQGAYWEMHDRLFAGQAEWAGNPSHVAVFKGYAVDLGLDATAFDACLDGGRWAEAVNANLSDGVGLGVRGTPSFFIDGYPLVGAQPYETFKYAIDLAEQGTLGDAYQPAP